MKLRLCLLAIQLSLFAWTVLSVVSISSDACMVDRRPGWCVN